MSLGTLPRGTFYEGFKYCRRLRLSGIKVGVVSIKCAEQFYNLQPYLRCPTMGIFFKACTAMFMVFNGHHGGFLSTFFFNFSKNPFFVVVWRPFLGQILPQI